MNFDVHSVSLISVLAVSPLSLSLYLSLTLSLSPFLSLSRLLSFPSKKVGKESIFLIKMLYGNVKKEDGWS